MIRPLLACCAAALLTAAALAEIIPASRRTTWTVGTTVGVRDSLRTTPGGAIITRPVVQTVSAAYGDGVTDATTEIRNKMLAASAGGGGAVLIPDGVYVCSQISFTDPSTLQNVTLRGSGRRVGSTGTKLLFDISRSAVGIFIQDTANANGDTRPYQVNSPTAVVSVNEARNQVTVVSAASMAEQKFVRVQNTGLNYVAGILDPSVDYKIFSSLHLITNVAGNVVTIEPPLPNTPYDAEAVAYNSGLFFGLGFESMTLDAGPVVGGYVCEPLQLWNCVDWWLNDIEFINQKRLMEVYLSIFGDIRKTYAHSPYSTAGGPGNEGISFGYDVCFSLVEDNVSISGAFPWITLGEQPHPYASGVCGNIVAYNYALGGMAPNAAIMAHGSHPSYNLIEGNVVNRIEWDGWHTSKSHNTIHRNWAFCWWESSENSFLSALALSRLTTYCNVIGNVLLDGSWTAAETTKYNVFWGSYSGGTSGTFGPSTPPNYRTYPSPSVPLDYNAFPTDASGEWGATAVGSNYYHGNRDYTKGTNGVGVQQWSSDIADHNLLDSYYTTKAELESRGVVWGPLPFPPIDPANPPGVYSDAKAATLIPAAYRYVYGANPTQQRSVNVQTLRQRRAGRIWR